jgi:hypothetical protein
MGETIWAVGGNGELTPVGTTTDKKEPFRETNQKVAQHYAEMARILSGGIGMEGIREALISIAYSLIELVKQGQNVYLVTAEIGETETDGKND